MGHQHVSIAAAAAAAHGCSATTAEAIKHAMQLQSCKLRNSACPTVAVCHSLRRYILTMATWAPHGFTHCMLSANMDDTTALLSLVVVQTIQSLRPEPLKGRTVHSS